MILVDMTGKVSAIAAEETGLKAGTPVAGGAGRETMQLLRWGQEWFVQGLRRHVVDFRGVFTHGDRVLIHPQGRVHTFCAGGTQWLDIYELYTLCGTFPAVVPQSVL